MASEKTGPSFLDKFAEVSAKVGNQVHLRSLRDAFATVSPIYILAGVAVLINTFYSHGYLAGMQRRLLSSRLGVPPLRRVL